MNELRRKARFVQELLITIVDKGVVDLGRMGIDVIAVKILIVRWPVVFSKVMRLKNQRNRTFRNEFDEAGKEDVFPKRVIVDMPEIRRGPKLALTGLKKGRVKILWSLGCLSEVVEFGNGRGWNRREKSRV